MPSLQIKIFAAADPLELEAAVNNFFQGTEPMAIEGFQFALDGLDLPYNLAIVYRTPRKGVKST